MSFLVIEHLYKQYDQEKAISDFSLKIPKGKVLSLVGESGSGKSTLLRVIAGLETQDRGTVHLNGSKILNPAEKLVAGYEEIQLIHQHHNLYPHSTVEENIARPLLLFDKKYKKERVELLLELLGLQPHRDKLPRQISGGQQQKVAIGRALSTEPKVLLLDEPFSSLDNIQKRELIGELKEIFYQVKITVLLVSHDMDDAMSLTDELCIIQNGTIVQKGKAWKINEKPKNYYVAKLLSDLNTLPGRPNAYVRPSDLFLKSGDNGFGGLVIAVQYLVSYNLLTVRIDGLSFTWLAEDRQRKFKKGDRVGLEWEDEKVLRF